MPQFLNLFTYTETRQNDDGSTVFENCVLLKKIGEQEAGATMDAICVGLELFLLKGDAVVEDHFEYA